MRIENLVRKAVADGASDIHLIVGLPPKYRISGKLTSMNDVPLTDHDCTALSQQLAGSDYNRYLSMGEYDKAASYEGIRCRINLFRQQEHNSACLRLLPNKIPSLSTLGLPPSLIDLTELRRGLIIVTGETGSGKSTTLAAMIDAINHSRAEHIITLENPIEYIYQPDQCIFNQREIGRDTDSYASGLRAALREDPNIILIGEMRDLETIETALTAAETGHLVLATLHTGSAADSIDRLVAVFPESRQHQIRMQLSMTLKAVLSQQLLPLAEGNGRVAACELMVVNAAIQNLIREGKTPQMKNTIATSAKEGSITMDHSILNLYKAHKITGKTAKSAAHDLDYIKKFVVY